MFPFHYEFVNINQSILIQKRCHTIEKFEHKQFCSCPNSMNKFLMHCFFIVFKLDSPKVCNFVAANKIIAFFRRNNYPAQRNILI